MTAVTIALVIIAVVVILLVALRRGGQVTAPVKLPGVHFSLEAKERRRQ